MEPKELKNKMKEFCDGDDELHKNCVELFEFGVINIGSIGISFFQWVRKIKFINNNLRKLLILFIIKI